MGRINPVRLARARADVLTTLRGTAIIKAPTRVSDGAGGGSVGYAAVTGGTVPYRRDPYRKQNVQLDIAGREALEIDFIATFPYNAPIDADYRVNFDGETVDYDIAGLWTSHSDNVSQRAYIAKVK